MIQADLLCTDLKGCLRGGATHARAAICVGTAAACSGAIHRRIQTCKAEQLVMPTAYYTSSKPTPAHATKVHNLQTPTRARAVPRVIRYIARSTTHAFTAGVKVCLTKANTCEALNILRNPVLPSSSTTYCSSANLHSRRALFGCTDSLPAWLPPPQSEADAPRTSATCRKPEG